MTSTSQEVVTSRLEWRGVMIEIRYRQNWRGLGHISHIEVETLEPAHTPLPITETGYRSRFIPKDLIEEAGGAIAFTEAWLNQTAASKGWIETESSALQLSLFD